jgi:hypothetical protein
MSSQAQKLPKIQFWDKVFDIHSLSTRGKIVVGKQAVFHLEDGYYKDGVIGTITDISIVVTVGYELPISGSISYINEQTKKEFKFNFKK